MKVAVMAVDSVALLVDLKADVMAGLLVIHWAAETVETKEMLLAVQMVGLLVVLLVAMLGCEMAE